MDKLNIAIADDNAKVLQLLDKIVSSDEELNVVGKAGNGEDLYDIIKKQEPDVVLLDLVMPKVDGLTVMERVNKDQEIRNIRHSSSLQPSARRRSRKMHLTSEQITIF